MLFIGNPKGANCSCKMHRGYSQDWRTSVIHPHTRVFWRVEYMHDKSVQRDKIQCDISEALEYKLPSKERNIFYASSGVSVFLSILY